MAKGRSKKVPQGEPSLLILPYNQHLLSAVYEVFYQAVHVTCAQHYNSEQLAAMHAANENIDISSLIGGVNFFKAYIKGYK